MTTSMGGIMDRSKERLGSTDAMVIRVRRRLIAAVQAHMRTGAVPPGVDDPEVYRVRSGGVLLPDGADWVEATRELRQAFVEHPELDPALNGPLWRVRDARVGEPARPPLRCVAHFRATPRVRAGRDHTSSAILRVQAEHSGPTLRFAPELAVASALNSNAGSARPHGGRRHDRLAERHWPLGASSSPTRNQSSRAAPCPRATWRSPGARDPGRWPGNAGAGAGRGWARRAGRARRCT